MRITAMLLIVFCIHACKENAQEKESEFELNKPEAGDLYRGFHLGGGLCVSKYFEDRSLGDVPTWLIRIFDCYDFLIDTIAPTENVVKYRQGGLCFSNDCSIEPENSFTMFMNVPKIFLDQKKYVVFNIFASKYNGSTMLYKHAKLLDRLASAFASEEVLALKKCKYELCPFTWEELAAASKVMERLKEEKDTIIFFKKHDKSWEDLFSIAKPLEIKNEDFSEYCNDKFCPTKDFLNPMYKINCKYRVESKDIGCYNNIFDKGKYIPKCLNTLEKLSEKYGIVLMHSGAFPAGDCDLGNWRYLKIDSLSKEHYEKLKDLVAPPDTISSGS